ncbi:MAG: hypothetical protein HPY60_11245 [Candidatus Methanofastidiosum sp.]|nr:hypothetical protein [Methanofastidiosum sp.]
MTTSTIMSPTSTFHTPHRNFVNPLYMQGWEKYYYPLKGGLKRMHMIVKYNRRPPKPPKERI